MNSAIESDSRKFADGDDVNHIMLSDNDTPDLQNPSPVTGYAGADMTDGEWGAYSYALLEQSYVLTQEARLSRQVWNTIWTCGDVCQEGR